MSEEVLTKSRFGRLRVAAAVVFSAYCLLMIWLLFGQRIDTGGTPYADLLRSNLSLMPFRTISEYIEHLISGSAAQVRFAVVNLLGNVIMFLPLGFLLPCVFRRISTAKRCLVWTVGIILGVELIQLFTLLGCCDIDDLMLNTAGSMLGFAAFRLIRIPL